MAEKIYNDVAEAAAAWHAADDPIEVTEKLAYYYLNVIPPVYGMKQVTIKGVVRTTWFGFAEGAERIVAFWSSRESKDKERFFAQLTEEWNTL